MQPLSLRRLCCRQASCGCRTLHIEQSRVVRSNDAVASLNHMAFDRPAPDLAKLLKAWEQWEKGEEMPGKVLANLKTAGLAEILRELRDSGWKPSA